MQPQQDQYTIVPQPPQQTEKKHSKRKLAGIILLIAPTALIIVTILLYAVVTFGFQSTPAASDSDLFGDQPVGMTVANTVLFIIGTVSVIAWLPSLITGIILLATSKKQ